MKKISLKSLTYPKFIPFILLFFTLSIAQGATFPQPPESNSFYLDTTNSTIDDATGTQFNQVVSQLLADEDVLINVVIIQSLAEQQAEDQSLDQYATQLFNNWGIGSQSHRYSALLLFSLDDSEMADVVSGAELKSSTHVLPEGLTFHDIDMSAGILAAINVLDTNVREGKYDKLMLR